MCTHSITLPNNSKYTYLDTFHRFFNTFACGNCAECQARKSREWQFRISVEAENCFSHGGYLYWDTLTYAPAYVPRLRDYFELPNRYYSNMKVFDYEHMRLFLSRLRDYLGEDCKDKLKYFYVTEYGTKKQRPHYHIIFYVYDNFIDPLELSRAVSKEWYLGRTEGLPWKSRNYVLSHNVIKDSPLSLYRVAQYISKYLEKDSDYLQRVISRLPHILTDKFGHFDLSEKPQKFYYKQLYNRIRQFHRQSLHFGESALSSIDLAEVFKTNSITYKVPTKNYVIHLHLPLYYKRKLFYNLYRSENPNDKAYYWSENELGKLYNWLNFIRLPQKLKERYDAYNLEFPDLHLPEGLAEYVQFRNSNHLPYEYLSFIEKTQRPHLFHYCTSTDVDYFGKPFYTNHFIGNSRSGYDPIIDVFDFTPQPYLIPEYEDALKRLDVALEKRAIEKENLFRLLRRQRRLKKSITPHL